LRALVKQSEPDERLQIAAAQQDPLKFAELYEDNFERVYAFIASRVRNREEAEDLTAEVFQQALKNLHRFEYRGAPFLSWLLRIAVNAMTDRWRVSGRETATTVDELDVLTAEANAERRAILLNLVNKLPDDQRDVVLQRFVEQRSIAEIARELNRSEGAIKQLQFRGIQSLRGLMKRTQS
jgi:RNA polymerase sigma-70 factor (ECF subfamily)